MARLKSLVVWLVLLIVVFLASALFFKVVLHYGNSEYRSIHRDVTQVA